MTFFHERYRAESIRIPGREYRYGSYFITICTHGRERWFGDVVDGRIFHTAAGLILVEELQKMPMVRKDVRLDVFIVMPDHVHFIVHMCPDRIDVNRRVETPLRGVSTTRHHLHRITNWNPKHHPEWQPGVLGSIINQFKGQCTRRIIAAGYPDFQWQPRYYETVIRNATMAERIRHYIINNPMRWDEKHLGL